MHFKNRNSIILITLFIVFFTGLTIKGWASNFKMVKQLVITQEDIYTGDVMAWKGTFDIRGTMKGTVMLMGGSLKLNGIVEGDVICISSKIQIGKDAVINGDLLVIAGNLNRHPQSMVRGENINLKIDFKKIESTLLPLFSDSRSIAFFKAIKIILWFIIALLVFAVLPKQINSAENIFEIHSLKVAVIGILSVLTFIFLLFIFIVMSFFYIGIPFLFLLIVFYFFIYIFGRTVFFYFIGTQLSKFLKIKKLAPVFFIVIGVMVYALIKFIPIFGPLVLILMNIIEVGISVGFILRKKFKLQS